jgi:hypothetical protein
MKLDTRYRIISTIEEEFDTATGKTRVLSKRHKTPVAEVARQLTTTPHDAISLARTIRYYLNQGNALKDAIMLSIKGAR